MRLEQRVLDWPFGKFFLQPCDLCFIWAELKTFGEYFVNYHKYIDVKVSSVLYVALLVTFN